MSSPARPPANYCERHLKFTADGEPCFPTFIGFRLDRPGRSGKILLHLTRSMSHTDHVENEEFKLAWHCQTRCFLLEGSKLFPDTMKMIGQYYDPPENPDDRVELKVLLPTVLANIEREVLADKKFLDHWKDSLDNFNLSRKNDTQHYLFTQWPGGNVLSPHTIEPYWYDDQVILSHLIEGIADGRSGWPVSENKLAELRSRIPQISIASVPSIISTQEDRLDGTTTGTQQQSVSGQTGSHHDQASLFTVEGTTSMVNESSVVGGVRSEYTLLQYCISDETNPGTATYHWNPV